MTSNGSQLVTRDESSIDEPISTPATDTDVTTDNGFLRIAIGVLVGATLGGLAGALTNRGVVDRINRTVKDAGDTVKKTATSVNSTVQEVGDAVHSVATGVNDTVKDVGDTVKETAESVNSTVKNALDAVKNTTEDVNGTVADTLDAVKKATEDIHASTEAEKSVEVSSRETLYKLVPVDPTESDS